MITTLQNVTPDGKKLIAVEVPINTYKHYLSGLNFLCGYDSKGYREVLLAGAFENNYLVLGTCTHDTIDFDVTPHIGKLNLSGAGIVFQDYLRKQLFLPSSQDSFRSLLSASGLEFNNNNKYVILQEI